MCEEEQYHIKPTSMYSLHNLHVQLFGLHVLIFDLKTEKGLRISHSIWEKIPYYRPKVSL